MNISGSGTVLASAITGQPGVVLLEMYDLDASNSRRFTGLSVRNAVGTGDDRLIAGFAINGNVPKRLAVRGVGPGLVAFGVSDALADPTMQIHTLVDGIDTVFASNDNWEEEATGSAAANAVPGLFPLASDSRDALILVTLPAGLYSVVVSGVGNSTGEVLVEVYEAL
jgi:hypothetical protein